MKIKSRDIALIVLVFFVIGIAGTIAINYWNTDKIKEPAKYTSGKFEGEYDPSDIRGSFLFADINDAFNVPAKVLAEAFGFKNAPNPETLKAQTVERAYGGAIEGGEVGTDSIRMFVAYYLGLPFTPNEEGTRLPRIAVSMLKSRGLTEEQVKSLESITVDLPILKQETIIEHTSADVFRIKGNTTFYELLDLGITKEEIEEILGMPMGRSAQTVRNFIADKEGMEFGEYKAKFEALIKVKK